MLRHSLDPVGAADSSSSLDVQIGLQSAVGSGERDTCGPSTNCRKDLQHHLFASHGSPFDYVNTGVPQTTSDERVPTSSTSTKRTEESHGRGTPVTSRSDAILTVSPVSSSRHTPRHTLEQSQPALEKDRVVLRAIVDLKYLSAPQLQRYLGCRGVTSVRRSLHRLESNGWITLWEHWTPVGGRTKYALPQRKALAWALHVAREEALGTPAEIIARTLLMTPRRPVRFPKASTPPFFLHQVRANDVVLGLRSATDVRVLWATAWDHPLPEKVGTFAPPQPDAILLLDCDGAPILLFVEMDRATQKLADFRSGKARYAGLALHPQVLLDTFGTTAFRTIVVVQGKTEAATVRRIQELSRTARAGGFAAPLTFTSFEFVQRNAALFVQSLLALPPIAAG